MNSTNRVKRRTFITFEGIEGVGKSTQCQMLSEYLKSQNIPVVLTREIGGSVAAEEMRKILVHMELPPMSELLQVMSARYDHIVKKILPAIEVGYTVICDRFIDSTACYQGAALDEGMELVYSLHHNLMPPLMPDITFFIDIEPKIAIERVKARNSSKNKFDLKSLEFYKQCRNCFKTLADKYPRRIKTINAMELSVSGVHELIKQYYLEYIGEV